MASLSAAEIAWSCAIALAGSASTQRSNVISYGIPCRLSDPYINGLFSVRPSDGTVPGGATSLACGPRSRAHHGRFVHAQLGPCFRGPCFRRRRALPGYGQESERNCLANNQIIGSLVLRAVATYHPPQAIA